MRLAEQVFTLEDAYVDVIAEFRKQGIIEARQAVEKNLSYLFRKDPDALKYIASLTHILLEKKRQQ